MSTFKNWTEAELHAHNAKVAGEKAVVASEGCSDESKLHEQIIEACKQRGFYYVHSRMDRRTTTALGVVDFIVALDGGRTLWVEAKAGKRKPTREQAGTLLWLEQLGHKAVVCRSLTDFLNAVDSSLKPTDPQAP